MIKFIPRRAAVSCLALALALFAPQARASVTLVSGAPDMAAEFGAHGKVTVGALSDPKGRPDSPSNSQVTAVSFGGKQWKVIGYKPEAGVYNGTVNADTLAYAKAEGSFMTLLASDGKFFDNIAGVTNGCLKFNEKDNPSKAYAGSKLEAALSGAYSLLSSKETALMLSRDLYMEEYPKSSSAYCDGVSGTSLDDAYFWPLSTREAYYLPSSVRKIESHSDPEKNNWWLRSPGYFADSVAYVKNNGDVLNIGVSVGAEDGSIFSVRPAFNLDVSSVFFTTAPDGKNSAGAGDGLLPAAAPSLEDKLGEMKFTAVSALQKLTVLATAEQAIQTGDALIFSYAGANAGEGQYISCALEDEAGAIKYYGKLAAVGEAAAGNFSVPLAGVEDGKYALKIFSEEINGSLRMDFCSKPVAMTLTVSGGVGEVSEFGGCVPPVDAPPSDGGGPVPGNPEPPSGGSGGSGDAADTGGGSCGVTGAGLWALLLPMALMKKKK